MRLAKLLPTALDPAQRELYDTIVSGPRSDGPQAFPLTDDDGGLEGPFNAMLLSPPLGTAVQALGAAVRYGSALSPRSREIAVLTVAARWNSEFELYAHRAVGRTVGLSDEELEAIRQGRHHDLADPGEQVVAATTAALAHDGDLTDEQYATATAILGLRALYEITTVTGYYALLALQLRAFRVPLPTTGITSSM